MMSMMTAKVLIMIFHGTQLECMVQIFMHQVISSGAQATWQVLTEILWVGLVEALLILMVLLKLHMINTTKQLELVKLV